MQSCQSQEPVSKELVMFLLIEQNALDIVLEVIGMLHNKDWRASSCLFKPKYDMVMAFLTLSLVTGSCGSH